MFLDKEVEKLTFTEKIICFCARLKPAASDVDFLVSKRPQLTFCNLATNAVSRVNSMFL